MDFLKLYREMADTGVQFRGLSILSNANQIGKFLKRHRAQSVLDYGSGAGDAYRSPHKIHHTWGLRRDRVTLYDPAFKQHARKPQGRFDVVICSDMLEHIPELDVPAVLGDIFAYAKHGVWLSVCCRPAKKTFPGTEINLHCTLHPVDWWMDQIKQVTDGSGISWEIVETP